MVAFLDENRVLKEFPFLFSHASMMDPEQKCLDEEYLVILSERIKFQNDRFAEQMLQILETRIDNVCYHLGFANTRAAARQLVCHGHVRVNGRKVNIPSFGLKVNDVVEIKNSNAARQLATRNLETSASRAVPDWLSLDKEALKGVVMRIPTRDEIQPIANEQAVVEFYSR